MMINADMKILLFIVVSGLFLLLITDHSLAQSPYHLNWQKETSVLVAGSLTAGLGLYYRSKTPILQIDEIELLDKSSINSFDRVAIDNYSSAADRWSDVFWGGSHLIPLLYLTNKNSKSDFGKIGALYGEAFLLNASVTGLIKYTARRSRPFVYNPIVDIEKKLSRTARTAFLSGHTSMTATSCFFVAKVYSDYFPNSSWKPYIWTGAAIIPALTGYLRIKAGKHYPTDTIAGYALGAAVGVLVPQLHKNQNDRLTAFGGGSGVVLRWRF